MDIAMIVQIIQSYGYVALFLIFLVGLFFFPVPNEFLLMSGGWFAATYLLDPLPSFLIIYLTIMIHGTILFIIGAYVSKKTTLSLEKQTLWQERAEKGRELLDQYGLKAASFSYFLPFVRHAVPFSVGISGIRYRRFALVGFTSAFVWLSVYFLIGFYYGRSIRDWATFIDHLVYTLIVCFVLVISVQALKKRKKKRQEEHHHTNL